MNYNTDKNKRARWILLFLLMVVMAAGIGYLLGSWSNAGAEDRLAKVWILCKPGTQVNVRRTPDKRGQEITRLDCGDWFMTDGVSSNGYIRAYGIGEYGEGWVYCGYVAGEEPRRIGERYVVVAKSRVMCRRWISGPKVEQTPWLVNGSEVQVFCEADGWAVTNRGYIQTEWLEVDPE